MNEQEKTGTGQGVHGMLAAIRDSQFAKIIMIGILTLLLQIPITMIDNTVRERQSRSTEAVEEVSAKWGRMQRIIGPYITVPYEREVKETVQGATSSAWESKVSTVLEQANFFPDEVKFDANTENMIKHRGIFDVPVYSMDLHLTGRFSRPDFSLLNVRPKRILWDQARINILITDPRAVTNQAVLDWNGDKLAFQPGGDELGSVGGGILVSLRDKLTADSFTFSCQLAVQGSKGIFFAPVGRSTEATIASGWAHPSFQGNWLPSEQRADKNGFRATWKVSSLGRKCSQSWIDTPCSTAAHCANDTFGVNFIQPVDTYSMAHRSIKYQFLFLALTFISLWLFEVLAKVRLHGVQYVLVGGGMCLFYLLELSLAEHIGFFLAYVVASLAIVVLETCYCMAILQSARRSAVMAGFIVLLYAYLYTLLINQDYALLAGSVGLFLLLGTIMYLTRKIDWYGLGRGTDAADRV
ncbi:MAG: cell envelope integrity protein CreD [Desulfobulbaceae bacterium A2]|nr:MAG: cell envelope integrity protein CreD [Desulfobulbaceae bacterium A2]